VVDDRVPGRERPEVRKWECPTCHAEAWAEDPPNCPDHVKTVMRPGKKRGLFGR
jgi:hypothetical protein